MESKIKSLCQTTYEIEGLALLIKNKTDNLPDDLIFLLKEKISTLQNIVNDIENTSIIPEEKLPLNDFIVNSNNSDFSNNYITENQNIITVNENIDSEQTCDNVDEEIDLNASCEINTMADTEIFDSIGVIEIIDEDLDIVELEDGIETEPVYDIDSEIEKSGPITLEEKIIRQNSKDLKQAFTINDRYRFRRELFGNSDTEFIDMLNLVSAMSSLVEAEEYFYGDLEWDKESDEVRDFMNIIAYYFTN